MSALTCCWSWWSRRHTETPAKLQIELFFILLCCYCAPRHLKKTVPYQQPSTTMMKTTSSLFTAILASILLTISAISTCTAFSVQPLQSRRCPSPSRPQPSYRVPVALFGGEDDESASVLETSDAETPVQQKQVPAVKCPDCDLCDGSGR